MIGNLYMQNLDNGEIEPIGCVKDTSDIEVEETSIMQNKTVEEVEHEITIPISKETAKRIKKALGINKLTRKRFKKLLMGLGIRRNDAEEITNAVQKSKYHGYTPVVAKQIVEEFKKHGY